MVSEKPWRLESFLRLLLRLLICFGVGALTANTLGRLLGDEAAEKQLLPLIVSLVCLHGAGLVAIALFVREHNMSWAESFGFKNEAGWAVVLGICAAIIVLPLCWWLQSEMVQLLARLGFDGGEQETVSLLRLADSVWKQILLGVFAIAVAPIAEELFFRGIIYPMLKQTGFPRLALWATALLFAVIHCNLTVFVPLTVLAIMLALLYEWTDNLLACIVVHSLFNAANFVMLFALKYSGQLPVRP
jgi:membrane protease YdiL (CAAX protease family)